MKPGERFGQYILLKRLAVGGMAEVYLAKTQGIEGFEKLLAIKIVHPRFAEDREIINSLIAEAKIAVQLMHVNIGQIFDLGMVDGRYYVSMEYIDGYDLFKIMSTCAERDIDVPFEVSAFVAHEVCAGLDYAHNRRDRKGRPLNLIHRDVSPQNIMVTFNGEVKLVDFGIAKVSSRISGNETAIGVIKGKFYYMSPEQAMADRLDRRSDIYSLGICAYETIAGRMLYHDEDGPNDAMTILDKIKHGKIPALRGVRKDVPREFEEIVYRALKKRREERFQAARDLQQALTQFLFKTYPSFNRGVLGNFMFKLFKNPPSSPNDASERRLFASEQSSSLMSKNEYRPNESSVIFRLTDLDRSNAPAADGEQADRQELRTELFTREEVHTPASEKRFSMLKKKPREIVAKNPRRSMHNEMPTRIVSDNVGESAARLGGSAGLGALETMAVENQDASGAKTVIDPHYSAEIMDGGVQTAHPSGDLEVDLDALLAKVDEKLAPAGIETEILDPNEPSPLSRMKLVHPIIEADPSGRGQEQVREQRARGTNKPGPQRETEHLSRFSISEDRSDGGPPAAGARFSDARLPLKLLAAGTAFLAVLCVFLGYLIYRNAQTVTTRATIKLQTTPENVEVILNGEKLSATTPLAVDVLPGDYTFVFQKEGFASLTERVIVDNSDTRMIRVTLLRNRGRLAIVSEPAGAAVWIKGLRVGVTPYEIPQIQLGEPVSVLLTMAGYSNEIRTYTPTSAKETNRLVVILRRAAPNKK